MSKISIGERFLLSTLGGSKESVRLFYTVSENYYDGRTEKSLRKFIANYAKKYGEFPPISDVQSKFGADYKIPKGSPKFYADELRDSFIYRTLASNVPELIKSLKDDPQKSLAELREVIHDIDTSALQSSETGYAETALDRYSSYEERVGTGGVIYLSTNDKVLDDTIYGYQKADLITIGGRSGLGKTWLMCLLANMVSYQVDLEEHGPILFITNEITDLEIMCRIDCLDYKISWEKFNRGELTKRQQRKYRNRLQQLHEEGSPLRVIYNVQTLEELEGLIYMHSPSIVFVDGSYLLEPKMTEGMEKTTYITRNLKNIAKNHLVPIINSTQLRKKSGRKKLETSYDGQDEFFYGSYVHDSDFAIRAYQDATMQYHRIIGLDIVKGRRIPPNTLLHFNLDVSTMENSFTRPEEHETVKTTHEEEAVDY